jgi:hypothetical protein
MAYFTPRLRGVQGFNLTDEVAVDARQSSEILFLGQHLGFECLQARSQRRATLPDLLRPDQPECRILRESAGVVNILIAGHAAVDGLAEQIGQGKLRILAAPRIGQMLGDETAQTQPFIQFAHQNESAIRSDASSLEIDLQRSVERELKWPILFLTHWVLASSASSSCWNPHE